MPSTPSPLAQRLPRSNLVLLASVSVIGTVAMLLQFGPSVAFRQSYVTLLFLANLGFLAWVGYQALSDWWDRRMLERLRREGSP